MSVQGIVWVLEECPDLPKHLVATMVGLANHADQNGRGAYPSQDLLAWYARKDERSVRRDLEQAEEIGIIRRGDQRMVLHLPADKRPVVYDLAMERKRDPRPDAPVRQGRPKKATPAAAVEAPEKRGDVGVPPDADVKNGGTWASKRGDVGVPRTALEPSLEPKTPSTDLSATAAAAPAVTAAEGGHISPEDKTRLTTAVDAAVEARKDRTGWARPAVVAAVSEVLDAGHPVTAVVTALAELAGDMGAPGDPARVATDYPTRLAPYLAHQARLASAVTGAETYRHKPAPPCGPSCDCWKHLPPAGEGPGISTTAAAAIAAARAALPAGKPLWRREGSGATQPRSNAGTAASGEISTESAPAASAA